MKALNRAERNKIANKLHPITSRFHNYIPLKEIQDILSESNLILIQEDNTEWSGLICGREGHTIFDLGIKSSKDERGVYTTAPNKLYFYWYKFDSTGRYEINTYLS